MDSSAKCFRAPPGKGGTLRSEATPNAKLFEIDREVVRARAALARRSTPFFHHPQGESNAVVLSRRRRSSSLLALHLRERAPRDERVVHAIKCVRMRRSVSSRFPCGDTPIDDAPNEEYPPHFRFPIIERRSQNGWRDDSPQTEPEFFTSGATPLGVLLEHHHVDV